MDFGVFVAKLVEDLARRGSNMAGVKVYASLLLDVGSLVCLAYKRVSLHLHVTDAP